RGLQQGPRVCARGRRRARAEISRRRQGPEESALTHWPGAARQLGPGPQREDRADGRIQLADGEESSRQLARDASGEPLPRLRRAFGTRGRGGRRKPEDYEYGCAYHVRQTRPFD